MAGNTAKFPLSIVVAAVDKATGPIRRIQSMIDRTFGPLQKLRGHLRMRFAETGIGKVGVAVRGLGTALGNVATTAGGLVTKFGLIAGAGAGAAFAVVRSFAKSGDEIAKASHRLGISTDKLQAWRYAADANGVAANTLEGALHAMKQRTLEASFGFGEARAAIAALNLDLRDSDGNLRSVESLLPEVADKLALIEDATVRNAVASKLFGGAGIEMTQILAGGAKGLAELEQRHKKWGGGMSEEAIKQAEEFIGVLADLGQSFLKIRNIIAETLLPDMGAFFTRLAEWIAENGDRIREFAERFMEELPGRIAILRGKLAQFWASMQPVIEKLREWAKWLSENDRWIGVVAAGLAALAGIIAAPLITALTAVVPAIIAVGTALGLTPIGWTIGIIAALVGAIVWLGDHWDWLGAKIDEVVGWVVKQVDWLYEKTVGALEGVGNFFSGIFGGGGSIEVAGAGGSGASANELVGASPIYGPSPVESQDPGELRVTFDNVPANANIDGTKLRRTQLQVGYALPEQGGSF